MLGAPRKKKRAMQTQAQRGKEETELTVTELTVTELTVTNTPDLRTLARIQSWAKNNLPERKNFATSSDRRGLQTVKEE